jgi:PKD repeat protein
LAAGLVTTTTGPPAQADTPQTGIVSADPVGFTPNLLDGDVRSIVQIGDRVFISGNFTQVTEAGSSTVITRNRVLAFNATTGKIDDNFKPSADGEVSVLLPAADGKSIYLGGLFTHIDGAPRKVLARLDVNTGQPVPGFTPDVDARVKDLRLAGGRLWIGGNFDLVDGVPQNALATLDPDTGRRDAFQSLPFSGVQNDGTTLVYKMDVTPDGSKLVAVGNFTSVGGQSRPQIVMLDLTGATASLADWQTNGYAPACSSSFDSYMRDVDVSPDGTFFVVSTTGSATGGTSKMCDTQARWETSATGTDLKPTWATYTGGDTTYAVEVTGSAVYVGGHFRWSNNPFGADAPGRGAVERSGIAALDPANGMPFQWNPGRTRGVGVFDLLATSQGLWMGSDTDETGGETHQKLALFPTAGGKTLPAQNTGTLPGDVYSGGTATVNSLKHRSFNGTTAGALTSDATGGIDWRNIRGAFMINDDLYTGASDGGLSKRSFDGHTFGAATAVNGADALVAESDWHNEVKSLKGMFYANGRIYYTQGTTLYYRGFNPESGVVAALEIAATGNLPGVDWSTVGGMFTAGAKLYYVSTSDGKLRRLDFTGGVPSGTPVVVDDGDWRGQAVFLYAGVPNTPPAATFTSDCDQLACGFDGSGSADTDGSITSYAWEFGDGSTGTGATPQHTYASAGTYTVKLTVTDDRGGTGTASQQVRTDAAKIDYVGTDVLNANTTKAAVTIPASVQAGDGLLLAFTDNDTSRTVTPPAGWQQVGTQTVGTAVSTIWQRVAVAGDAGHTVSVGLSDYAKADLRILAYRGTNVTAPVAVATKAVDPATTTSHTSPTAAVAAAGSWVVTYWSDKSSATLAWTPPNGVTSRGVSIGSGSGRVTSLTADSGGAVPTGTYGGLTATTDAASRALTWTIVLAPGQ